MLFEGALALDPNFADTSGTLGQIYFDIGQYEKAIEFFDKAIRLNPQRQQLAFWYAGKGAAYFGQQHYDQAIKWSRGAIAINPNFDPPSFIIVAALALTGHESEAREQLRVALSKVNVAVLKAFVPPPSADPRARATFDRIYDGLRMAGMPKE